MYVQLQVWRPNICVNMCVCVCVFTLARVLPPRSPTGPTNSMDNKRIKKKGSSHRIIGSCVWTDHNRLQQTTTDHNRLQHTAFGEDYNKQFNRNSVNSFGWTLQTDTEEYTLNSKHKNLYFWLVYKVSVIRVSRTRRSLTLHKTQSVFTITFLRSRSGCTNTTLLEVETAQISRQQKHDVM